MFLYAPCWGCHGVCVCLGGGAAVWELQATHTRSDLTHAQFDWAAQRVCQQRYVGAGQTLSLLLKNLCVCAARGFTWYNCAGFLVFLFPSTCLTPGSKHSPNMWFVHVWECVWPLTHFIIDWNSGTVKEESEGCCIISVASCSQMDEILLRPIRLN